MSDLLHADKGTVRSRQGLPTLGVFATVFKRRTLTDSLMAAHEASLPYVHLDLAMVAGETLPQEIEPEIVDAVQKAVAHAAVRVTSIEGTYNMAHPDPAVREQGRRRLELLIEHAHDLGAPFVTLCTGTRADGMWRFHPDNSTPSAWTDMRAGVEAAVEVAESRDVVLCIECEYNNVVSDARCGRRLLDEVSSPALRVALDAANLVPPDRLRDQDAVLEEAFALLGEDVVIAHAKDISAHDGFVAAGTGALNYALYLELLAQIDFTGVLVLHSLAEREVETSLIFLRRIALHLDGSGDLTPG